ncbi:MAG: PPC domain-containing protein [Deltaproteobacteria bacterium]|nr:PPC domain-containing protein [Deltaproteobacteria bacterium]
MIKRLATLLLAAAPFCAGLTGCMTDSDDLAGMATKPDGSDDGKYDASALAVFVDFEFDGQMITSSSWGPEDQIQDQLLYTIGQLNGANSVGRLDTMTLSNVKTAANPGGGTLITYHAKLPVAWGNKDSVPSTFTLKLPKDQRSTAVDAFVTKYKSKCAEAGAHDVDAGSLWYYFRPSRSGCTFTADEVVTTTASVTVSTINTTGKFPEYDKVWADNALEVVAVFGKYEDGATTAADAGIDAYNDFVAKSKTALAALGTVTSTPATIPSAPGVANPDVELRATLPNGRTVHVVAMLTDNITRGLSESAFRARYEALSTRADLIAYNGHAGLGQNIRALARNGKWVKGQYLIMFQNGCDTFAYVDSALNDAHSAVNTDDPNGTKYLDIVNNGMPAFFANMSASTLTLVKALAAYDEPKTYEQIFRGIDKSQVVLVTGEQDNTFTPGGGGTVPPTGWAGMNESGSVAKSKTVKFTTPVLAAGTYVFDMTGDNDADLYIRRGKAPTQTTYDCRPYKTGSNESCEVTIDQPTAVYVMVRGYGPGTTKFALTGKPQ